MDVSSTPTVPEEKKVFGRVRHQDVRNDPRRKFRFSFTMRIIRIIGFGAFLTIGLAWVSLPFLAPIQNERWKRRFFPFLYPKRKTEEANKH